MKKIMEQLNREDLSTFLSKHSRDNVLIVLDTSAWLRLFRAAPNRVPGFLFNYFNCGYPLRITGHILEEFDKNLEYVEKDVVEVQEQTAYCLDRGKSLDLFAMNKASSENKGEVYKKLLSLYGGKDTNGLIGKSVQAITANPVAELTAEEAKQGEAEVAQLVKEKRPFPGSGDLRKVDNLYGDYLIYLELQKLAKEENADIVFATFDLKERDHWYSFEEEFKKKADHELRYVDIPAFDEFTDCYGTVSEELGGREIRNKIINENLANAEDFYKDEAGKAVEVYFALGLCFFPTNDWRKNTINVKLLDHKEAGFKINYGTYDSGGQTSYDCSFGVEVRIEVTYQIITEDRRQPLGRASEEKTLRGTAQAIITRRYGEPQDILDLAKEHWMDVSNIDLVS